MIFGFETIHKDEEKITYQDFRGGGDSQPVDLWQALNYRISKSV